MLAVVFSTDALHLLHSPLPLWYLLASKACLKQVLSKEPRRFDKGLWSTFCKRQPRSSPPFHVIPCGKGSWGCGHSSSLEGTKYTDCECCGAADFDPRHLVEECPAFAETQKKYSFVSIVAFYRFLCPLRFLLSLRALDFLHSHLRNLISLMVQPSPISMCAE